MRRTSLLAALLVSVVLFLPGCNLASRNRVQAINRMNEGIGMFDKNNTGGAEKALQEAIQLDPKDALAYLFRGTAYSFKLDFDIAPGGNVAFAGGVRWQLGAGGHELWLGGRSFGTALHLGGGSLHAVGLRHGHSAERCRHRGPGHGDFAGWPHGLFLGR